MSRSGRFRRRVCSTFARQPGRPAVCWPATESQSPASAPTWPPPAASARPWPPDWTLAGYPIVPGEAYPRPENAPRSTWGYASGTRSCTRRRWPNCTSCWQRARMQSPLIAPSSADGPFDGHPHGLYITEFGAWLAASSRVQRSGTPPACGSWLPRKPSVTGRVGAKRAGRCSVPVAGPRRWARLRRGQIRRCGHRCRRGGLWTASTDRGRY